MDAIRTGIGGEQGCTPSVVGGCEAGFVPRLCSASCGGAFPAGKGPEACQCGSVVPACRAGRDRRWYRPTEGGRCETLET